MAKRKFYKTIVKVEVLTEVPLKFDNLADLDYIITNGDGCGLFTESAPKILDGKQAAKELYRLGSEPEFFRLNKRGETIDA